MRRLGQIYASAPVTSRWTQGSAVRGSTDIQAGTAIATFIKGKYLSRSSGNHAAFYLSQNLIGIWVVEQYRNIKSGLIRKRFIPFRKGKFSPSNDGDAYSVIE
ncbi:BPSL0067 family protein [Rugamonas sp.]|uniref:BPSL0067 family protein n=1 Tax=Rugamonas sp. TaxID=1926287 RepID=UPI0025EBF57E|nr:BPSL0067 family protein [Rugamonas sp.]